MIALLCPTRARQRQFFRMIESAEKTAFDKKNFSVYALSNGNDQYVENTFKDIPTVMMWNMLAKRAMEDKTTNHRLFMLCADDVVFSTPGWDQALHDHYNALENKVHVYSLQDSRDVDGTPHPIVTREYIDAMGYFMPPVFLHWYVDTWTIGIAQDNNCFTHLKDYLLVHEKPSDYGQGDETHYRIRWNGWNMRDKYVNDTCQHFLQQEKKRLGQAMNPPKIIEPVLGFRSCDL